MTLSFTSNKNRIDSANDGIVIEIFDDKITHESFGLKNSHFSSFHSIKRIKIPSNIVSIDLSVIRQFNSLESIIVNQNNLHYLSIDGILYSKNGESI